MIAATARHARPSTLRAAIALAAMLVAFGVSAPRATAYWQAGGAGSSSAGTTTIPGGVQPSLSVAGDTVTVSFDQVSVLGQYAGAIGGEYEVRRYPAGGGAAVTPGGACGTPASGAGATLSCDETSTPPGDWRYSVTPILNSWTGAESPQSLAIDVAPAAPTGAAAALAPGATIDVTWSAVGGAAGYNLYRRTSAGSYNYSAPLNGATPLAATSFNDTTTASGTTYLYEIRAVVIGSASQQIESVSSAETTAATADGTAPTAVTMTSPGTNVRGTVTLSGSATDTISGVASVTFEYKLSAGSTWTAACSDTTAPYSCAADTTGVADDLYDLRVRATDGAGNETLSAVVAGVRVDNTAPAVTITDPGAYVRQTIALDATATDTGSGMASVLIEQKPSAGSTWTTVCTDTTSPYSCSLDTTLVADGDYDFRATATDVAGNQATAIVATRRIDNTAPTAIDIQTANGTGTLYRPTTGDTVTYTFSEPIQPTSILAGWNGASTNVTVRLNQAGTDTMTIFDAANTAQLPFGSTTIGTQYVTGNRRFTTSPMVMSGNSVTITLGTRAGGFVATATANVSMTWTPSATVTDLAGNPMSTTARTETGAADREF
ncbi:MAG: Ig-like domain-containing protein [Actinobacteria bacterium]|nr:Ig-like domain-containing protein [Actinomycetota bacterium]